MALLGFLFRRTPAQWKVCLHGEWRGPFTLNEIRESNHPNQFLMAEGASDEDLEELLALPAFGGLAIMSPHVTIAATATLQLLPQLRELILCGPPITDEFLLNLAAIATLREITLVHTSCTSSGVQRFMDAATKCSVYKAGADSIYPASLRRELQLFVSGVVLRWAAHRKCVKLNGVWTDEGVDPSMPVVNLKAKSEAWYRMLKRHPEMSEVFQLGDRIVWVTPSRTVLIMDASAGEEQMSDVDIDRLFTATE